MTAEEFILLNKSLGHNILHTKKHSWLLRGDGSALSLPTLEDVHPSRNELASLLSQGARIVLFKTDLPHKNCYEYLFVGDNYSIELFDSKIRNQIRKGLKNCIIKDASINDLTERGLDINNKTLDSQNRKADYLSDKNKWNYYISKMKQNVDVFIKGAYVNDVLVAYIIFIKVKNKYYIYHPFMDKEYSSYCPMNALIYSFINEVLDKEVTIDISYGLASYSEKNGLDKFKKGMLFTESECTRVVVVSRYLSLFINDFAHAIFKIFAKANVINESYVLKFEYLMNNKKILGEYLRLYGSKK